MRSRFHALLDARIREAIAKYENEIARGVAKDYPNYQCLVGRVMAYDEVLVMCDEIDQEMK